MSLSKTELLEQKKALIAYLLSKVKASDWHACQDAASDIREIDAKLEVLNEQADIDAFQNRERRIGA